MWDIAGDLEDVFDSVTEAIPRAAVREGLWHPTMDIYDLPQELLIELELPGVDIKDVKLTVRENHLIVEGNRRLPEHRKEQDRFFAERLFGAFHRVVHLPAETNPEKVEARFHEGLLVIRMPKSARAGGKLIEIRKE